MYGLEWRHITVKKCQMPLKIHNGHLRYHREDKMENNLAQRPRRYRRDNRRKDRTVFFV